MWPVVFPCAHCRTHKGWPRATCRTPKGATAEPVKKEADEASGLRRLVRAYAEVIVEYGQHHPDCERHSGGTCDCGWVQVLRKVQQGGDA